MHKVTSMLGQCVRKGKLALPVPLGLRSQPRCARGYGVLPPARDAEEKAMLDRMLRVDHAGEYGANRIYAGQMAVLGRTTTGPLIQVWTHLKTREDTTRHFTGCFLLLLSCMKRQRDFCSFGVRECTLNCRGCYIAYFMIYNCSPAAHVGPGKKTPCEIQ